MYRGLSILLAIPALRQNPDILDFDGASLLISGPLFLLRQHCLATCRWNFSIWSRALFPYYLEAGFGLIGLIITVPVLESVSSTSLEDLEGWAIFGDKKDSFMENGCSISNGRRKLSSQVESQFASGFLRLLCPEPGLSCPSTRTDGSLHRAAEIRTQRL